MTRIKEIPDARKGFFYEPVTAREIGKQMDVVVLKVDTIRTLWETGNKKPRCFSDDGIVPSPRVANPVSAVCEGCEFEKKDLVYRVFCYDVKDSKEAGEPAIFTIDCKSTQLKAIRAFVQAIRSKGKAARDFTVTMRAQEQSNEKGQWHIIQFENIEQVPSNIKNEVESAYKAVNGESDDFEDGNESNEEAPF